KEAEKPVPAPEAGDRPGTDDRVWRQQYKVTLTPEYVNAVRTKARDEWVSHEKEVRQERAVKRQTSILRILGGLIAVLLVVAGYLRLEEATRGYYTAMLRVAAIGVLLVAAM